MTKLECNVTNCLHNADNCCCKQSIMVDGHDAKKKEQTCCGSLTRTRAACSKMCLRHGGGARPQTVRGASAFIKATPAPAPPKIGIAGDGASRAEQTLCTTFQMS